MRTFQPPAATRFYAGVDLHARACFVVLLDQGGQVVFAKNLPANPEAFLRAVAPFRDGLLVACECMHCWYWLADTCRAENIPFVLGHARAMKAVHGCKTRCDRKDAEAIARLLKGGNFAPAYAYPKERRGLRDLLRARLRLVRQRAQRYGHVHTEPGLTGHSSRGVSPTFFEWPRTREQLSIGTGPGTAPGTAARLCGVGPPESAWVLGAARLGSRRPPAIAKPGRRRTAFATAAVPPGARGVKKRLTVPGPGEFCLLTWKA